MNHKFNRKLERRKQRRFIRRLFNLRADHDKNSPVSTSRIYSILVCVTMYTVKVKGIA